MFRLRLAAMWGSQSWLMPHTFCQSCESCRNCGADPLVRAVPLDPLFANEISIIHTAASRRGRRLRTGGVRPTINADCAVLGKVCGIGQSWLRGALWAAFSRRLPDANSITIGSARYN